MNQSERKALKKAGKLIAKKCRWHICGCLPNNIRLHEIPEAKLFNPGTFFWWGIDTMGELVESDICRNARLLGIAFMLTMPKEILEHKFTVKINKK